MQLLERQKQLFLQKAGKEKPERRNWPPRSMPFLCRCPVRLARSEKLFGSVTTLDLQKFLSEKGFSIDRRRIHLPAPIKSLGTFSIPIKLHPEVTAQLKVKWFRHQRQKKSLNSSF